MEILVASSSAMDLRQLTHLMAVAAHGSFSAAARSLHTVQSNVSTHVARLEKELAAVLIDRRSMLPTTEGKAVIDRAQRIRSEMQALKDDISSMREEIGGTVRIGCIGTTARWMATPLLERLGSHYPGLHPILVDAPSGSLYPLLRSGEVDFAILNGPVLDPDFATEPLFDEELIVVTTKDHALADHETVTIQELAEHEVMLTPTGTTFRDTLDAELAAAGLRLRPKVEIDGLRLLTSLAYPGYAPPCFRPALRPAVRPVTGRSYPSRASTGERWYWPTTDAPGRHLPCRPPATSCARSSVTSDLTGPESMSR